MRARRLTRMALTMPQRAQVHSMRFFSHSGLSVAFTKILRPVSFSDSTDGIVLNHAGGPIGIVPYAGRRETVFEEWQASINYRKPPRSFLQSP